MFLTTRRPVSIFLSKIVLLALAIALLADASYATSEVAVPGLFCWDASINATGYRVYWSTAPDWWPSSNMNQTAALCLTDPGPDTIPGEVIFFVVTAYNVDGESETGHGPIV
jgi:hypothetical protein